MRDSHSCKASVEERRQFHVAASSRALLAYRSALLNDRLRQQRLLSVNPLILQERLGALVPDVSVHPSSLKGTTPTMRGSNLLQAPEVTQVAAEYMPDRAFESHINTRSAGSFVEAPPLHAPTSGTALAAGAPIPLFNNQEGDLLQAVGGSESFPMVLLRALAELVLVPGGTDIATFLPSGKAFQIRNQFLFETSVLPFFFPNMKSFASFQRQLNLYNFKRIAGAGVDRGAYRHDMFVREFPARASHMKRTKIKRGRPRGAPRKSTNA